MIEAAKTLLLESQNPDGGWGAVRGRRSNTEATSLALMALKSLQRDSLAPRIRSAIVWLTQRQLTDGSWPFGDGSKIPSWSSAMAMLALGSWPEHEDRVVKAAQWVLRQEGRGSGWLAKLVLAFSFKKRSSELNEDLTGWPWTAGTLSWVEPTSYFLIAIKKVRRKLAQTNAAERIRQAELMIYDRMCRDGGWNYGNSVVLGEKLWPYPDVTAVALVALQDHRDEDANRKSLKALEGMLREVDSGLSLSWSVICASLYGQDAGQWKQLLVNTFARTRFLEENKSVALALLALGDGAKFFKI